MVTNKLTREQKRQRMLADKDKRKEQRKDRLLKPDFSDLPKKKLTVRTLEEFLNEDD